MKNKDSLIKENVIQNPLDEIDTFLKDIDLIVILNNHEEIRDQIRRLEKKILFDTKNLIIRKKIYKL